MKKLIPILLLVGSTMLTGCGDSQEDFVFTNTGQVALAPIARNDAYATNEDTPITIPAGTGVLANDTLNAVNAANVTVTFPNTTAQGGTVTLAADTGAFTYTPAVGFVGTDTFNYTLSNGFAASTATVTITVTAVVPQQGFFVDSVNGNDATGDFATGAPYATIQGAVADAPVGADIVIRPGNYVGAITLKDGQRLLGAGSVLAQGELRPELTGPVILADGNTLDYLRIEGSADDGVTGDNMDSGTITNCEIISPAGDGIQLEPAVGRWVITDNVIDGAGSAGVIATAEGTGVVTYIINDNDISDSTFNGIAIGSEGTSGILAQVNGNNLSGNASNGTVEVLLADDSEIGLDLEDNTNDNIYAFFIDPLSTASLQVEQLATLTQPKPAGAGNTGIVDDGTGIGGLPPTEVPNGTFDFGN